MMVFALTLVYPCICCCKYQNNHAMFVPYHCCTSNSCRVCIVITALIKASVCAATQRKFLLWFCIDMFLGLYMKFVEACLFDRYNTQMHADEEKLG